MEFPGGMATLLRVAMKYSRKHADPRTCRHATHLRTGRFQVWIFFPISRILRNTFANVLLALKDFRLGRV
jgi:hypothetical protein